MKGRKALEVRRLALERMDCQLREFVTAHRRELLSLLLLANLNPKLHNPTKPLVKEWVRWRRM